MNAYFILKDNYTYNHEGVRQFSEISVAQYFDLARCGVMAQYQSVDSCPSPDDLLQIATCAMRHGYSCWFGGYQKGREVFIDAVYIDDGSSEKVRKKFFLLTSTAFAVEDGNDNGEKYLYARWLHFNNSLPLSPPVRLLQQLMLIFSL